MNPHFSMPFSFLSEPKDKDHYSRSKVVILPVPYDQTTTYKSGTREGPHAIIDASRSLESYDEELNKDISEI